MNGLAQAIVALINSKPVSPRVDELDALIKRYVPTTAAVAELHLLDPSSLGTTLPPLCATTMRLGPRIQVHDLAEIANYAGQSGAVVYAHPVLLVHSRDGQRKVNGMLVNPPRLYIGWYDVERDRVVFSLVSPWGVVEAVAPQQYSALTRGLGTLTQTMP